MARRRIEVAQGASDMPAHLMWSGMDDPRFWDSEFSPTGLERFHAHRRHRVARSEYLASLTNCPSGVRPGEFLMAHGFNFTDAGDPKTAHLKY